uniref:Nonstructural protein n=1 Tax=Spodoptera exempta insect virus 1 TaxID=2654689 RepID=A0A5P8LLA9_9VIRU|nr:nonstructural protein [Spodoptera exempta insect virus 1]
MAFIGTALPFCQRHFTRTKSYYCPSWAIKNAGVLVRSPVTIDDIRADIKLYGGPSAPRFEDPVLDDVIRDCYRHFKINPVRPIHLNDIPRQQLDNWNSSPGLPWKEYGFKTKREVALDHRAFQSIRRTWHLVKEGESISLPDCAAYVRPHLVPEGEKKVRAVWGYPTTVSFMEACFALPLIDAYKKSASPMAYGFETARGGCRKIFQRMAKYKNFMSSDYSRFDKTVPAWLIRIAFDILLANIDLTRYKDEGIPDTEKLYRAWKKIITYFINTPIRMCNGERYRKNRGVASGSYFTQLIDSIVNWIVTQYSVRKQGVSILDHLVLGDDSLIATDRPVHIPSLVNYAKQFGMHINEDKTQQVSSIQEIKFLGYQINTGGPSRPLRELCAALAYPERPDRDFNDFATRALGLLIANFGHHLDFDACCRAVLLHPHHINYSPSISRYLRVMGIDQLPKEPPDLFQLQLWRYRT